MATLKANPEKGSLSANQAHLNHLRVEGQSLLSNSQVTIYPNPVTANYDGDLIISGVVGNAMIKFATIDGAILYETRAIGSMVSWDLIKFNGDRLSNGVYLVFVTDMDGSEKWVGKFAIVR